MTDYPILMSAPMVRALLDGRKTQTRRLAWGEHAKVYSDYFEADMPSGPRRLTVWQKVRPGDRLWVRETWADPEGKHEPAYFADMTPSQQAKHKRIRKICGSLDIGERWRPSIHMPRRLSRLTLVVTAARMERVREISADDARAEGCCDTHENTGGYGAEVMASARAKYRNLWQSLHTKPGTCWNDNPEVVAITFTEHLCNIDAMTGPAQ